MRHVAQSILAILVVVSVTVGHGCIVNTPLAPSTSPTSPPPRWYPAGVQGAGQRVHMDCESLYSYVPTSFWPLPRKSPGYISEYGNMVCETEWDTPIAPWTFNSNDNTFNGQSENNRGWTATCGIACGMESGLTSTGPVNVTNSLEFSFSFTSLEACVSGSNPTLAPTLAPHCSIELWGAPAIIHTTLATLALQHST